MRGYAPITLDQIPGCQPHLPLSVWTCWMLASIPRDRPAGRHLHSGRKDERRGHLTAAHGLPLSTLQGSQLNLSRSAHLPFLTLTSLPSLWGPHSLDQARLILDIHRGPSVTCTNEVNHAWPRWSLSGNLTCHSSGGVLILPRPPRS